MVRAAQPAAELESVVVRTRRRASVASVAAEAAVAPAEVAPEKAMLEAARPVQPLAWEDKEAGQACTPVAL